MVRKKQVNNENGAVLNRDFPRQGRSLIMVPEELKRLYPNAKPLVYNMLTGLEAVKIFLQPTYFNIFLGLYLV